MNTHLRTAHTSDLVSRTPIIIPCILNLAADVANGDTPTITVLQLVAEGDKYKRVPVTINAEPEQEAHHLHADALAGLQAGDQRVSGDPFHVWRIDGEHSATGDIEDAHRAVFGLLFGYVVRSAASGANMQCAILTKFPELEGELLVDHDMLAWDMKLPKNLACFIPTGTPTGDAWFLSDVVVMRACQAIAENIASSEQVVYPSIKKLLNIIKAVKE